MQTSDQINELAAALAKAQGEITGALKESANPFFKSKYADLASCWDACRAPLSTNGLSVVQGTQVDGGSLYLITRLLHSSGQWVSSQTPVTPKDDTPQGMGSALTYSRRYALTAMVGVSQVDDDGNSASGRDKKVEIPEDPAIFAHSVNMRELLDMDTEHRVKVLKIYDKHLVLAKDNDLYEAASNHLTAAQRKAWKEYVKEAKELDKEDRAITNIGKRF